MDAFQLCFHSGKWVEEGLRVLSIGDINLALCCDASEMTFALSREAERFRASAHTVADATVTARWGDLSVALDGEEIFDSNGLWKLFRQGDDYVFRFTAPAYGEHAYKQARFTPDFIEGEVTLHQDYFDRAAPAYPLEYPLDELLMTNLLARGRGVEVHALGIRDVDGRGYLFVGHSGAGKSTTARLWEGTGALVLSDDRIILRQRGNEVWMYGTPWHGEAELAAADCARVDSILILGRGTQNERVVLSQAQAVSALFARSFVPFYDADALGYSLEALQRVAATVPCAELRFVPDAGVVDFVRSRKT